MTEKQGNVGSAFCFVRVVLSLKKLDFEKSYNRLMRVIRFSHFAYLATHLYFDAPSINESSTLW